MQQVSLFELPVPLTHDRVGGHEGKPIGTLQIISTLNKCRQNPKFFALSPDEIVRQGVTPIMQKRYLFWLRAFKLVGEGGRRYYLTPLAKRLLDPQEGLDPYLESTDSLWYLHWQLLKPTCNLPVFYWAFNHFYQPEFKLSHLLQEAINSPQLQEWLQKVPTERQIEEELRCLMKMYCDNRDYERESIEAQLDNPWRELRLILSAPGIEGKRKRKDNPEPTYHINVASNIRGSHKPSAQLIMACCIEYAMRSYSTEGCLRNEGESPNQLRYPISQLSYGVGSPGMVFKLSTGTIEEALDQVHRQYPALQGTQDANFKAQILIEGNPWQWRDRLLQDCLQEDTMVPERAESL